ncbi:protein RRP6-like 2 isoform X2 [Cicer arietinum]|nr:protein RRP6-like 2 isoform X2 [Cicer arietinum]
MDINHHLSDLSISLQSIPSDDNFRFHYNFPEFRHLIEELTRKSQSMLNKIGSSDHIWGTGSSFPSDIDDAYEWIVNANEDVLELVDELVDEFHRVLKEEGEDGFLKIMKEKKKGDETKPKVSFHVHTLRKPQYHYNLVVDNSNVPFEHVWLEKSEDGQRFIHPLEKFSVLDFVDKDNIENLVPVKPPPMECTPFKLVEEVKGLKELAAKLSSVNEFAVDLEHNQYRSFQGLTCLMQISTRNEDFIVDTLKLRDHVGTYLREVFKDPTKKKVLHGADRDIVWLQRDFGIYVCNMFDTGQASRVLKLERYSLQYLLQQLCEVTANKEYQNADWRVRPLPDVMIRYGREDTHYLLYIYDLLRIKLFALSKESESSDDPLLEVYQRSYNVCMKLYEKELLTEDSYLHIKGLRGAGFNGQQLAVVSGLCEWRDILARAEDESTGFILPNKVILEIAKQMPVTASNLRRLVAERSRLPYVERNHDIIVNIVRHSMQNAAAFEEAALRLKEEHAAIMANIAAVKDGTEAPQSHTLNLKDECEANGSIEIENATCVNISEESLFSSDPEEEHFTHEDENRRVKVKTECLTSELPSVNHTFFEKNREDANNSVDSTVKENGMSTGTCDATLLGNSASQGKCYPDKK